MQRLWMMGSVILAGCVSDPAGPPADAFAALIAPGRTTPLVRNLHCAFVAEEGSEWVCRYQEQASTGRWVDLQTVVVRDGGRWMPIDGVCSADEALADRGRCRG